VAGFWLKLLYSNNGAISTDAVGWFQRKRQLFVKQLEILKRAWFFGTHT